MVRMTTLRYLASSLYIDNAALTLPDLDLELDLTSAVARVVRAPCYSVRRVY